MASECVQRSIDSLLDEADQAVANEDWTTVVSRARGVLRLDSDQASDQADQDGWATGTPCQEAAVSVYRGAGDQENADRDTGTDQPASTDTWLACFESTCIYDSYGVVQHK